MNRFEKEMINHAFNEIKILERILTNTCSYLKYNFEITNPFDGDELNFSIDGIPFSIGWDVYKVKGLGGVERPVVRYQLFTYRFIYATRHEPEEWIDIELANNITIHECMKKALTTVADHNMNSALEAASFSIAKEQAQSEAEQYIEHV